MKAIHLPAALLLGVASVAAAQPVPFHSPGFAPSSLDAAGRLVEDWGTLAVQLSGPDIADGPWHVSGIRLDDVIPAARAVADQGAVRLICTAYRAPVFPAGVDVLTVRLEELRGQPAEVTVALQPSVGERSGLSTVKAGGRNIVTLPREAVESQVLREWGYSDEATSLPRWAKPAVDCDPAFRNIRAGLGGVPIRYRFAVPAGSRAQIVLGFCESHWAVVGQRPLDCRVEGAEPQSVDPVARWGRHQPGALAFPARDLNQDGRLDVAVRCTPGAPDANPILNALWIFPAREPLKLEQVVAGELSATALRYVDAGGTPDQSIYPPDKIEYQVRLAPGGAAEWTFLAACLGGAAPTPETSVWTAATLRRAAREVWRDWPPEP